MKALLKKHPIISSLLSFAFIVDFTGVVREIIPGMTYGPWSLLVVTYFLGLSYFIRFGLARRRLHLAITWVVSVILYGGWFILWVVLTDQDFHPSFLFILCVFAAFKTLRFGELQPSLAATLEVAAHPPVSKRLPPTPLPRISEKGRDSDIKQGDTPERIFHMSIKNSDPRKPMSLDTALITAESWVRPTIGGEPEYGVRILQGADPLHVAEANSAVYWKQLFDSYKCSPQQAVRWLADASKATANTYLPDDYIYDPSTSEMALLAALARPSIQWLISHIDDPSLPPSFRTWFVGAANNFQPQFVWSSELAPAERLSATGSSGKLDAEFTMHLAQSVGLEAPQTGL
jgi:hypothetical protein